MVLRMRWLGLAISVGLAACTATVDPEPDAGPCGGEGPLARIGGAVDIPAGGTLTFVDWHAPTPDGGPPRPAIISGPQGGQHIWAGVQMRGLAPKKLRMAVTLWFADTGEKVLPGRVEITKTMEAKDACLFEYVAMPAFVKEPCKVQNRLLRADLELSDLYGVRATDSVKILPGAFDGYCPPGQGGAAPDAKP